MHLILCVTAMLLSWPIYGANYNLQTFGKGVVDFTEPSDRPFRAEFYKMAPGLDSEKPLGLADYSGWTYAAGHIIGSVEKSWVMAYDAKVKLPKWKTKIDSDLTAPILVAGSWVIVGTRAGEVLKLEAATGKVLWRASLDAFVSHKMALSGPAVIMMTASQHIYSLDLQTGKVNWLYDGGFPEELVVRSITAPLIYNQSVFFGVSTGEIVSLDLNTGVLKWKFNPKFSNEKFLEYVGEFVVLNGKLIFTRYDGLLASISISSAPSTTSWSKTLPSISTSAFRGGRFYLGFVNGDVHAYEASSGKLLWRSNVYQPVASITPGETSLYLAGSNGAISMLDSKDGTIKWIDHLEGRIAGPGIYIEADIYFATGAKNLYGFKIK